MKRLQLSLRDLFWLIALVALGCGWWIEHRRHTQDADTINTLSLQRDAYMQRAEQLLRGVQELEYAAFLRSAAASAPLAPEPQEEVP